MKKLILRPIILLLISLVSCAPLPRPEPLYITNSKVINKSFDDVWVQIIEYLSLKQIQLKMVNKESGFIDTEFMRLPTKVLAEYAWTGGRLPSLFHSEGRIKANIFVKKISDTQTSVSVNTWTQVFESYPFPRWIDAKSTGKFESSILDSLR